MAENTLSLFNNARLWRALYWSFAALVLLVPGLATIFAGFMGWSASDFVFAGVLTGLTGLVLEVALRTSRDFAYRMAVGVALAAAFLLIWINAAVGIIDGEGNPANLMFAGVLAVALVGSLVARLRARDMATAMVVTAGAQALVFAIAAATGQGFIPIVTMFWCALWLGSAALFARAARAEVA